MSWGKAFSDAWDSATDTAKEAVSAAKESMEAAADLAVEVAETARDTAVKAAEAAKDAAVAAAKKTKEVAVTAKDAAVDAAEAAKDAAIAAANKAKEVAIATKDKAVNTVIAVRDKVANTYTAVKQKFELSSARNAAIHACPDKDKTLGNLNCPELADEAAQVADAIEKAKMADAVYFDKDKQDLPEGVTHATDEDLKALGLMDSKGRKITEIPNSDFKSEVYKTLEGKYVVAFKGTTFTSTEDWKNNIQQGLGNESKYYSRAMAIASKLEMTQPGNVDFVGHSLGGGLASSAAAVSGAPATTFNAAGLNDKTLAEAGFVSKPDNINAYTVKGDILSSLQDNTSVVAATAAGNRMPLSPADSIAKGDVATGLVASAVATPLVGVVAGSAKRGVRLHSMGSVKDALDKRANQITLLQKHKGCP